MAGVSLVNILILVIVVSSHSMAGKRREDKKRCPHVKGVRNFDLNEILGKWYVVQYYASSEEALSYRCMREVFTMATDRPEVSMNFTYIFTDDPEGEKLVGNITWRIPNGNKPAHWVHAEDSYEGVYNTYVLDWEPKSWALLLHCAEKSGSPRYLSSFIMSRRPDVASNVVSYLREKLPRYDIDLDYMFPMSQENCSGGGGRPGFDPRILTNVKHPMKVSH